MARKTLQQKILQYLTAVVGCVLLPSETFGGVIWHVAKSGPTAKIYINPHGRLRTSKIDQQLVQADDIDTYEAQQLTKAAEKYARLLENPTEE